MCFQLCPLSHSSRRAFAASIRNSLCKAPACRPAVYRFLQQIGLQSGQIRYRVIASREFSSIVSFRALVTETLVCLPDPELRPHSIQLGKLKNVALRVAPVTQRRGKSSITLDRAHSTPAFSSLLRSSSRSESTVNTSLAL